MKTMPSSSPLFPFLVRAFRGLSLLLFATILHGLTANASETPFPVWENHSLEDISLSCFSGEEPQAAPAEGGDPEEDGGGVLLQGTIDPEITALAVALGNDPLRVFNHVRNHIDYEHYHGLRKGAKLTLIEESGNDFDQCTLLAHLLTAAGYTDWWYRYRSQIVPYADLMPWLGFSEEPYPGQTFQQVFGIPISQFLPQGTGLTDLVAKQAAFAQIFLKSRGSSSAVAYPTADQPYYGETAWERLYLEFKTPGGVTYDLDPSYKLYETVPTVQNLASSIGYDRGDLLTAAGGTAGAGYIQALQQTSVEAHLVGLNSTVSQTLTQNHPGKSVSEITGDRRIIPLDATDLNQAFPLEKTFRSSPDGRWTAMGDPYKSFVRFQAGTMNYALPTADLAGRKISLTFSGNTLRLRFDDADPPVATTTVTSSPFNLTLTVTHPGYSSQNPNWSKTVQYKKANSYAYAIPYGFNSAGGNLLRKRFEKLTTYRDQGLLDDSEQVRTEVLNVMGLTFNYQTSLLFQLLAAQNNVSHILVHSFGRMADDEGVFIDQYLTYAGAVSRDGVSTDGRIDNVFQVGSLFASALEHGLIEQNQPDLGAMSTVNVLRKANQLGHGLYLADSSNWASVKAQLTGYGDLSNPAHPLNQLISQGARIFLPQSGAITDDDWDWTGSAWISRTSSQAGMTISGGYKGGYSTTYGDAVSIGMASAGYASPLVTISPTIASPRYYGSDPVDMRTGAFTYAQSDLTTGTDPAPRGLNFTRQYSTTIHDRDSQNLGYGWTHSLHIRAVPRTASEEALGQGTVEHVAPLLTSVITVSDLYRSNASAQEWGTAALIAGWFVDQMLDNAVSITIGDNVFQFIKQPDGSYQAPAGSTQTLEKDAVTGNYRLHQRLGNTFHFEPSADPDDGAQRIQKIADPYAKELTFTYHDGEDRLDSVEDAYDRTYTFTYAADDQHITGIVDSTGRSVSFAYDAANNLISATDPETKITHYDYDLAGAANPDPAATVAAVHRIVRLRNHDDQIITHNFYDLQGRVIEQHLQGDPAKSWKLSYTGPVSFEENPEGDVTTYFYDDRGRATGKRDANGHLTSWTYDGQDRIKTRTSGSGEITAYHYDPAHNPTQIDHPRGGGSTFYAYDDKHRPEQAIDPDGHTTNYVYFASGPHAEQNRPYQVIDPLGTTTFAYFDSGPAAGNLHTVTDGNGLVTTHAYDAAGQPDYTDAPGGFRTDFTYTARGDLSQLQDPNQTVTKFTYNTRRQVTQVIRDFGGPNQAVEDRLYDNMGNPSRVESPVHHDGQRVTARFAFSPTEKLTQEFLTNETATETDDLVAEHHYDGRDWKLESLDAAGRLTQFVPYANGQVHQAVLPLARNATFSYDGDGRLTGQTAPGSPADRTSSVQYLVSTSGYPETVLTRPDGLAVTSEFDRRGNLRFFTNARGHVFEHRYDALGRTTHVITPLGQTWVTAYNHRGAPASVTEPSGQTAMFNYNSTNGRLSSATYSDGSTTETVSYTSYDSNGNLQTLSEGSATIQRSYDSQNRVTSYTDPAGNQIGYRYYQSGKIAKIIYPGGSESGTGHVDYRYWQTGRLKEVIDKLDSTSQPRITSFTWNADGKLQRVQRPNGTERRVSYDAAGRPSVVEEFNAAGQIIGIFKNGYFPSDELSSLYRLPPVATQGSPSGGVSAMTFDAANQLATFETQSVTHDGDGNMTYGPLPSGTFASYTYDIRNRLTQAGGLTYTYDPEGTRSNVSGAGDTISYVTENSLGLSKVIQRNKNGSTTRYIWGVGLMYEVNASGEATYYHYDHVGSTVALTDQTGAVLERIEYAPFGTQTFRQRTPGHEGDLHDTPFLFTGFFGNQTDSNGLVFLRSRYYNPLTRRFLNSDPAREGSNWYAYADGNPMGFVDPTGLGASRALDAMQTSLSFLGLAPVVGPVFDVVNAGVSLARGDPGGAAFSLVAAVPLIGDLAGGAKIASRAAEAANVVSIEAQAIRFSQSNVRSTLPELVGYMKGSGWGDLPSIDVVRMADGGLTAVDNTRLAAAGLTRTPVQAVVREFGEPFPMSRAGGNLQGTTWGEAVLNRINNQKPGWQRLYPNGSPFTGVHPMMQAFTP